jgi:TatD DNase family protein
VNSYIMAPSQIRFCKKFLGSSFFDDAVDKDIHEETKNELTTKFEAKVRICDGAIIDSHCHLDLLEEQGFNIEEIIENSLKNNVKILQTICTKVTEIDKILSYTKNHDFIYASLGIHPCNVASQPKTSSEDLIKICQANPKIIGIGETGLDYFHDKSTIDLQKTSFLEHIKTSQKIGLPLIIHSRNADLDMMEILENEQKNSNFPALLHCFSSSKELAKKALDLGIYISISGIVTFKNATELQEIVKYLPLEFLLVETDSPYLAPIPHRGKTNQPAFTRHVVEFIAQLKGLEIEEVAQKTTQNFLKIFKL